MKKVNRDDVIEMTSIGTGGAEASRFDPEVSDRTRRALAIYIQEFAVLDRDPLCPELITYNARDLSGLGRRIGETGGPGPGGLSVPFWALVWPGGRALARVLLDHPELCRGKRVLDIGCGSGVVAMAAYRSGGRVHAVDKDEIALELARRTLLANSIDPGNLTREQTDPTDWTPGAFAEYDLILAGDLGYEGGLAERILESLAASGRDWLFADPDRGQLPAGIRPVARMRVPVMPELENVRERDVTIYGSVDLNEVGRRR